MPQTYAMRARVWRYSGAAAWHFATVPALLSRKIKKRYGVAARGWGSLPVHATVGDTRWRTSIFPDKKAGAYLLPLKADVRERESIRAGATIALKLELG